MTDEPKKWACPYCGRLFADGELTAGALPYHDDPPPCRSCCLGSKFTPLPAPPPKPDGEPKT